MKRILFASVLILLVGTASFAREVVADGKTYTAAGNYRIEIANKPFMIMGKELKAFIIKYENSDMEVTVALDKSENCMTYYVMSPDLSVKYICNGKYFGISRLEKELEKEGYRTSDSALNRSEYFHQRVISTGRSSDLEHAKLIAVYYPMLLSKFENAEAEK